MRGESVGLPIRQVSVKEIFFKFWIKEGFHGFLQNPSFIAKIMIQSINKSKETKRGYI
jgi:hypothetical protein